MKISIIIVVSAIIILAGAFFFLGNPSNPTSSVQSKIGNSQENQKLPNFTLDKYDGSGKVTLSESYKEKPTIVQFWATWCVICRGEFKSNNDIASKYKDKINYIAVDWAQGDKKAVADYIKELGLDPKVITFVMDENGGVGAKYGVRGTPVHIFIKKGGEVSFAQTGGLTPQTFEQELQKIL